MLFMPQPSNSFSLKWALVDCNSFFASCETLFRPDLKDKPVIVLSSNDGCIVAANRKAKSLGLKMFAPYFEIKKELEFHGVAVFSSNFALYADMSRRVNATLAEFSPQIEIYSIDECFINITGIDVTNENSELAKAMKKRVESYTGIPVCVGVGATKVLAKVANVWAKKNIHQQGICLLDVNNREHYEFCLKSLEIEDLWGIGRKSAPKLRAIGIRTIWDFAKYSNEKLIQKLLTKTGAMIQQELLGVECLPEDFSETKKKQIMCSRSFAKVKSSLEDIQDALANFATEAAQKLRRQKSLCTMIVVYIRTSPFRSGLQYFNQNFYQFESPTNDTRKIIRAAFLALTPIFKEGVDYKKAGILLCDIVDENEFQPSLFDTHDYVKDQKLMDVLDKINNKEGSSVIKIAACSLNPKKEYISLRNFKSPAYTTRWLELPHIGESLIK